MPFMNCLKTGDYEEVNEDFKDENCNVRCGYSRCKIHPEHDAEKERIESSLLGKAAYENLSATFGLSQEDAHGHVSDLMKHVLSSVKASVGDAIREASIAYINKHVGAKIKEILDGIASEIVQEEVLQLGTDDAIVRSSIRSHAVDVINKWVKEKSRNTYGGSQKATIQRAVDDFCESRVDEAMRELKKEVQEEFNKAAMKKMMRAMATELGDDKKFMAVLTA